MFEYDNLQTEKTNADSVGIDKMTATEIVTLINKEDKTVPFAVEAALPQIAQAVELITDALKKGGRLFYVGAGTSGRLGVLDASECPPTYGVSPELVQGIIAGGRDAAFGAVEGAEDKDDALTSQLEERGFCSNDVCVGLSASGSAPCVQSALKYARSLSAVTVSITCNPNSPLAAISDVAITADVGPEVIQGSTRMKSGTAQKLILNMLSTAVMVKLGRVIGNRLVYMKPSNKKLTDRAVRIIMSQTSLDYPQALAALEKANGEIEKAIAENKPKEN